MSKYSQRFMAVAFAGVLAACGTTSNNDGGTGGGSATGGGGGTGGGSAGFARPAGTIAVGFTVDDSANKVFAAGDFEWKGSMKYDSTTRIITKDSSWGGPFAKLYDDGPWTTGGHEPVGNVAGDKKWGIAAFVAPPATGEDTYEYGLIDSSQGNGWIWRGTNGSFKVAAGATADITATGQAMPPFGTTDFKLVIDKNALLAGTTWDTSKVRVKGSGWTWTNVELFDDGTKGDATAGDGKYTFELSQYVGAGKQFPKIGLGASGDKFEFVFVFGTGDGVEYKNSSGEAASNGVTAFTKASGGSYTAATIAMATNKNTYVQIP